MLDPATVAALALRCAPHVAPQTLLAVARVESGLDPLAIGTGRATHPVAASPQAAARAAGRLLAAGQRIDLGLAQINSANLAPLGLSVEAAFDPCRSLAAASVLLRRAYTQARSAAQPPQSALRTALSVYNTGDPTRGLRNGYVARVVAAVRQGADPPPSPAERPPAAWDAFGDLRAASFVLTPSGDRP